MSLILEITKIYLGVCVEFISPFKGLKMSLVVSFKTSFRYAAVLYRCNMLCKCKHGLCIQRFLHVHNNYII